MTTKYVPEFHPAQLLLLGRVIERNARKAGDLANVRLGREAQAEANEIYYSDPEHWERWSREHRVKSKTDATIIKFPPAGRTGPRE